MIGNVVYQKNVLCINCVFYFESLSLRQINIYSYEKIKNQPDFLPLSLYF